MTLTEAKKELDISPMFHLSLSSLELFHSNFLAWIVEKEKGHRFAELFLESVTGQVRKFTNVRASRESNHFDLRIFYDESIEIVIEVKVKSLPNLDQLRRYSEKGADKNREVHYLLLSLTALDDSEMLTERSQEAMQWKQMSFEDLAGILGHVNMDNDYHNAILNDYIEMIKKLAYVVKNSIPGMNEEDFYEPYAKVEEDLERLRLDSPIKKLYFAKLRMRITEIGKKLGVPFGDDAFSVNYSYTNGSGLVEIKCALDSASGAFIGVQIQGVQLREFVISKGDGVNEKFARLLSASDSAGVPAWFKFIIPEKVLDPKLKVDILGHSKEFSDRAFAQYSNKEFIYNYIKLQVEELSMGKFDKMFSDYFCFLNENKEKFTRMLEECKS